MHWVDEMTDNKNASGIYLLWLFIYYVNRTKVHEKYVWYVLPG